MLNFKNIIIIFFKIFNLKIKKKNFSLEKSIPEISETEKNIIETCSKYSMTSKLRMYVLSQAIKYVKNENIEGDFVECGIWKGGNIILFNKFNLLYDLKKKIYGFDTFEGMSEPDELDKHNNITAKELAKEYGIKKMSDWCYSSYDHVVKNISKNTIFSNIFLIKGNVEQTLLEEKNLPEKISILRLDTDWYASTKIELEVLYKKLVKGGILIIDDYGHWQGARKAVDEYFKNKNIWLHYVDYTCRYIIKK
jgi:O-methyltransferase